MLSVVEGVKLYNDAGFVVFPCGKGKDGKEPFGRWKKLTESQNITTDYFAVHLPEWCIVLDWDPRNGEHDLDLFLRQMELTINGLDTFTVETQHGGLHIYFKINEPIDLPAKMPGYPAIDIKKHVGYVIGAGSNGYDSVGDPNKIRNAPPEIIQWVNNNFQRRIHTNAEGAQTACDDSATMERYRKYLAGSVHGASSSYELACKGLDFGLSEDAVFSILQSVLSELWDEPISDDELRAKIANARNYKQNSDGHLHPKNDFAELDTSNYVQAETKHFWDLDNKGTYKQTLNNAVIFFHLEQIGNPQFDNPLRGLFKFNEFSSQIEFAKKAPWQKTYSKAFTDTDLTQLAYYISKQMAFDMGTDRWQQAVVVVAHENRYNPLIEELDALNWDGKPRLDSWLVDYCYAEDNDYTRTVGRITLIGAVKRAKEPGCKFDTMLVLECEQSKNKSTLVEVLAGDFFLDMQLDPSSKDTPMKMAKGWVIEISEMEFTTKHEVKAYKQFMSCKKDVFRAPYDRYVGEHPRRSVFIGSINPDNTGYLKDTTGNRRFLPVAVGAKIDIEGLKKVRDQLFAEAMHYYRKKEPCWIVDPRIEKMADEVQQTRQDYDVWEEIITESLEEFDEPLTTSNILYKILLIPHSRQGKLDKNRIGLVMKHLGYERRRMRVKAGAPQTWVWCLDVLRDL